MKNLYEMDAVLDVVRAAMAESSSPRGASQRLASAAGCQPSYFSQVLKGKVHFTPDHAMGLAAAWQLDEEETEFFLLLLSRERAATQALRAHLTRRVDALRTRKRRLSERFAKEGQTVQSPVDTSAYYADWLPSAAHMATSIPELQSLDALAYRLDASRAQAQGALALLARLGLVESLGRERYSATQRSMHLPSESPFCAAHHRNWRLRALDALRFPPSESLHYTALHALARKDVPRLRDALVGAIEETRSIVEPSPEEDLVCLTMDFFRP